MNKKLLFPVLMAMLVMLAGCIPSPKEIVGAERDAILAYSEPMADNELAALNANDYDAFIKDYDETMRKATTPENFAKLESLVSTRLGKYQSREVISITPAGEEYIQVIYLAKFENEEGVTIRIVFHPDGDHLISGFWMTSPKLRE